MITTGVLYADGDASWSPAEVALVTSHRWRSASAHGRDASAQSTRPIRNCGVDSTCTPPAQSLDGNWTCSGSHSATTNKCNVRPSVNSEAQSIFDDPCLRNVTWSWRAWLLDYCRCISWLCSSHDSYNFSLIDERKNEMPLNCLFVRSVATHCNLLVSRKSRQLSNPELLHRFGSGCLEQSAATFVLHQLQLLSKPF